jgi:hypothetical protein
MLEDTSASKTDRSFSANVASENIFVVFSFVCRHRGCWFAVGCEEAEEEIDKGPKAIACERRHEAPNSLLRIIPIASTSQVKVFKPKPKHTWHRLPERPRELRVACLH